MMESIERRLSLGSDGEVGSLENRHSLVTPRRKNPVANELIFCLLETNLGLEFTFGMIWRSEYWRFISLARRECSVKLDSFLLKDPRISIIITGMLSCASIFNIINLHLQKYVPLN